MTHPPYLREKARQLRLEERLTLDEIAERLALPKTTVWCWISDLPAPPRRATAGQALGNAAMQNKYRVLREEACAAGRGVFAGPAANDTYLRAQLQAWMDIVREQWSYTQPPLGA